MKQLSIPFVCAALLLNGVTPLYAADMHAQHTSIAQDCEINKGACTKTAGAVSVTLEITPKPVKAMQELVFTVTLKGAQEYENLKLTLQMPGMYMGNNEVKLVKTGSGKYTGKGIIPKCSSGRKLWSATVAMPGVTPAETPFLFNVAY